MLSAFGLLGQFEEREQLVQYLLNVAGGAPGLNLAPLYRVDGSSNLEESILENWAGYNGEKPVRIGNAAALHSQHDIYGEMVLALTPIFLDERMSAERSPAALRLMEGLARKAISLAGVPDAGIWEYRTEWKPQTFSSLMCWAAADRMARIADLHQPARADEFHTAANRIRDEVIAQILERDQEKLCGPLWRRRPGCIAFADGSITLPYPGRSTSREHTGRNPQRPGMGRLAAALQPERWIRQAYRGLCDLYVLVDRGLVRSGTPRRSAGRVREDPWSAVTLGTSLGRL